MKIDSFYKLVISLKFSFYQFTGKAIKFQETICEIYQKMDEISATIGNFILTKSRRNGMIITDIEWNYTLIR